MPPAFFSTQTVTPTRTRACRLAAWWLLSAVVLAVLPGCGTDESPPPDPLRPVRYQQVFAADGVQMRTFTGVAQAGAQAQVSFRVSGVVEAVSVQVGAPVQRGTVLARLDASDYVIQQRQAEAAEAQATAHLRHAEATYERTQQLYADQSASQSDLDAARAQYESAQAQVRSAEAQRQAANQQISYTRLTAPIRGAVAEVLVEVGEQVGPGRPAAVVSGGERLDVLTAVPEGLIGRVQMGTPATVRFGALGPAAYEATVGEVGIASTANTTTFPVTVRLARDAPEVRAGMAAEVTLALDRGATPAAPGVIVPAQAVGEDRAGRYVFVLADQGHGEAVALRRRVETTTLTDAGITVIAGVEDGALVVTAGLSALTDSQRVALLNPPPPVPTRVD
ncbi:MAG: efflux RND transporter periplasmic adaptor subunit [Bacteroidota bacterium]